MPPVRDKLTLEEARIAKATEVLQNSEYKAVAGAARRYIVPYQRLLQRHHGRPSTNSLSGLNKALDGGQKHALLLYIDRCHQLGQLVKHRMVEIAANSLPQSSNSVITVSRA
jgi:hypothetical protein